MDNNLKLSDEALVKIIDLFRQAILEMADISQNLRDLRFVVEDDKLKPL